MVSFELETLIAAAPEECFSLSLSVDAHTSSMSQSNERAVAGVTSGELAAGDTVTWRGRHFGVPFHLTSVISEYEHPHRFVDEQVRGPFKRWRHEHEFVVDPAAPGSGRPVVTRMIDRIDFSAPFGPLGRLVERLVLTAYMRRLIERRNDWLKETLERGSVEG